MWVGWNLQIENEWRDCSSSPCEACWYYYNLTFDPYQCNNWICLDSSSDPDGNHVQTDKFADLYLDINWKGCDFDYILAHENQVPGVPNSRIKI